MDMMDIILVQSAARRWLLYQSLMKQHQSAVTIQSVYRGHLERQVIRTLHTKATVVQSVFRGHFARLCYEMNMMDITIVQSVARRWLLHQSLMKQHQSTVIIQSAYRGHLERQVIRTWHTKASVVQSIFRGHFARLCYEMNMMDIILVQSVARRWLLHQSLMKQHQSAVIIQSTARRRIASGVASSRCSLKLERYLQTRSSVTIQRLWRGYVARISSREHAAARRIQKTWRCFVTHIDFLIQVISVIKLQATVRQFLSRNSFYKSRRGFVKLQAIARGNSQRSEQLTAIAAAVAVQSAFRAHSERSKFMVLKYAATTIQRWTRGYLCRVDHAISCFAACEIQRVWRGYSQFVDFAFSVLSAIKIQSIVRMSISISAYRAKKLAAWVEKSFVNKKALIIQDAFHRYGHRKRLLKAANTIEAAVSAFLHRKRIRTLTRGMIRLQGVFRARLIRRQQSKNISNLARRIFRANKRAKDDPRLRLGYRTGRALAVLQTSTSLSEIMEAVKILEASTRLSVVCCEVFTKANAGLILLEVVRKCNRSVPHVELVHCILLTLDNVAQHRDFLPSFAECSSAEVFLDKVQTFRDKDAIFCLSVDLLKRIFDYNPIVQEFCGAREYLKRLKALHKLSVRGTQPTNVKKMKTRENRMKRRAVFDKHQAVNVLGGMIRSIETLAPSQTGHQKHFTF
jgi:abnormal spindle-like microcephaly-associated protein